MPQKIAFVGPGIMGRPMIMNLLRSGHSVYVYARRPEQAEPLTSHGAKVCATPKDAAEQADICITMVADTADVQSVAIEGKNSLIHGMREGNILIDMSTISALATRTMAQTLAKQGIEFLDAPVSGGEKGAIDGSLSIMVGGSTHAFECALPILKVLGKNIVHLGSSGAGQIAKACNQLLVAQTMLAVAEAFELASAAKVDPKQVRKALLGGFAYSRILEHHGAKMLDEDYQAGFKARLHLKDLRNALATAKELGLNFAGLHLSYDYLQALVDELGDGELDSLAIQKIVRQKSVRTQ